MKHGGLVLLVLALLASPAAGDTAEAKTVLVRRVESSARDAPVVRLEADAQGLQLLGTKNDAHVTDFPLTPWHQVELELTAFDILTPDARLVVVDAERKVIGVVHIHDLWRTELF